MKELYLKVLNSEISLEEFETEIDEIRNISWDEGYNEGLGDGFDEGYSYCKSEETNETNESHVD